MTLKDAMSAEGLNLVAITPVEIRRRVWACLAFEPLDATMNDAPHLALVTAPTDFSRVADLAEATSAALKGRTNLLTRIHSECLLGDAFGSSMCDCGEQMRLSMGEMVAAGRGIFIYLRQEGRGIGMRAKLDCLALQYGFIKGVRATRRYTSDEANVALGHDVDERSFLVAGRLLRACSIASVHLVTGNPQKLADLAACGVAIVGTSDLWSGEASDRAEAEIAEKVARGYIYQR